jgi:hypothetical protein
MNITDLTLPEHEIKSLLHTALETVEEVQDAGAEYLMRHRGIGIRRIQTLGRAMYRCGLKPEWAARLCGSYHHHASPSAHLIAIGYRCITSEPYAVTERNWLEFAIANLEGNVPWAVSHEDEQGNRTPDKLYLWRKGGVEIEPEQDEQLP